MKSTSFEIRRLSREARERLHQVIAQELTRTQREVLMAYYFQDMNIPRIARERGVHKSTVSRVLRRAEKRIKKFLQY